MLTLGSLDEVIDESIVEVLTDWVSLATSFTSKIEDQKVTLVKPSCLTLRAIEVYRDEIGRAHV